MTLPRDPGSRRSSAPSRRVEPSRLRRATQLVLVLGTIVAVAAAFGPIWLVRVGVVVSVAAGVLACSLAWRELYWARRQHAKAMLKASKDHSAVLSSERSRNADVVKALSERVQSAGMVISGQRVTIAQLRTEVSSLNGDKAHLVDEVGQRDGVISALRETVQAREAELVAVRGGADAEVHHMPRRVLAEEESAWSDVPAADELWGDGSHPTVVDLRTIDTAVVLPNYEDDRQVG